MYTLSCPSKSNSKRIELTVHTFCYCGLSLTLCYMTTKRFCYFVDLLVLTLVCCLGNKPKKKKI